jgi:two-component system nitrogen regulation response regulator GlnG/two-component system response regulator HydG
MAGARSGDTTRDAPAKRPRDEAGRAGLALALAIVWSSEEPDRCGEVFVLPPDEEDRTWTIGRGLHEQPTSRSALPVRQRPGRTEKTRPLLDPCLSRVHLAVRVEPDALLVECTGRRPTRWNGREAASANVVEGDLVEIDGVLSLLCVRRPESLRPMRHGAPHPDHAFGRPDGHGIVGESTKAWELRDAIAFAGPRSAHVLLLGETGTGKELVARALHGTSPRAHRRLVSRNAATLPAGLVDSELYGTCAGYPQAGMPERPGLVGDADGGTLLLDEIGEVSPESQTHLLRFLDEGEYHRLGDARRRRADVRVICATNRPAEALKEDFAARFPLRLVVPSLSLRREDVPLLLRHLLSRMTAGETRRVSQELIAELVRRPLPANVRELEAVLWRALEATTDGELAWPAEAPPTSAPATAATATDHSARAPDESEVRAALERHQGVQARVWKELGLPSRFALRRLMQRYGIKSKGE